MGDEFLSVAAKAAVMLAGYFLLALIVYVLFRNADKVPKIR